MSRVRRIVTAATVIAGGVTLGAGVAQAAPHRAMSPGVYQSWGPNWVYDDGAPAGAGKGVFGERADATAVGGTQSIIDFLNNGRPTYIQATYYFYGPRPTTPCDSNPNSSCWYVKDSDRFANWSSNTWHSQYGSTGLVGNADRARGYYKACEDIALHTDPCGTTSILTASY